MELRHSRQMDTTSPNPIEEIDWRSDDYLHTIHEELISRVNDMTSQVETGAQFSPSPRQSLSGESVSSSTSDSSTESTIESHAQRVSRLKSTMYTNARLNDGCTFLMMEGCTSTLLGRALRGNPDIQCMSTVNIDNLDSTQIQDGWRIKVLSTPHKSMNTVDLNYIRRELEASFGADAGMDASPRMSYTIALLADDCSEYASFVAFRTFAVINHKRKSKMMFVYIDHIVTNKKHRRKHLGMYMIDLIKRACTPVCQMYRISSMHFVTQASFEALPFWSTFMHSSADACLIMLKLIQMSDIQDESGPNRRTGRFKIKLFADVIDMMMEVPVL